MNRDAFNSFFVLFLTSPVDFLLELFDEPLPELPTDAELNRGRDGNWHHSGKDWWTEAFRADAQWWSKLARFLVWWLSFALILAVAL